MAASLRLSELTKIYGTTRAVDRLSLSIAPGNMVALLGPSGCGKTTTLRMIAGLVEPNAGDIFIDDRRITRVPVHRRNFGMLVPESRLVPAYDGRREYRLRPRDTRRQGCGRSGTGRGRLAIGAAVRLRRPAAVAAVRGPAATGLAGPGTGRRTDAAAAR